MPTHRSTLTRPPEKTADAQAQPPKPTPAEAGARFGVVPYITRWSAERTPPATVIARGHAGVAYADEHPEDRDGRGVLWMRVGSAPGQGRPEFGSVHLLRQRRVMRRLLCQVCAAPADRNELGVLWLLGDDREERPDWPEQLDTIIPPVCLPCARKSLRMCPHLRRGHVAVRVREPRTDGVQGILHHPGLAFPRLVTDARIRFDDPRIHWVRAGQLVASLYDCTLIDLAAGQPLRNTAQPRQQVR
jgi:hypothetical protein